MERLEAKIVKKYTDKTGQEKTYYTKIGTAWPFKQGGGYTVVFDALPVPEIDKDGKIRCAVILSPPQEKPKYADPGAAIKQAGLDAIDDLIPF